MGVTGHLILHGTGTVTNTTPLEFYGGERSSLSGTPPTFHGISLVHTGAWEVRVNNGSEVGIVYERSTVRVVPNGPATTPVHEAAVGEVRPGGRLILDGTIDDPVQLEKDARLVNAGEIVTDHTVIQQSMENTGLIRAGAGVVWVTPAPASGSRTSRTSIEAPSASVVRPIPVKDERSSHSPGRRATTARSWAATTGLDRSISTMSG